MKIGKQTVMPHTGEGSYSRIKPKSKTRVYIENDRTRCDIPIREPIRQHQDLKKPWKLALDEKVWGVEIAVEDFLTPTFCRLFGLRWNLYTSKRQSERYRQQLRWYHQNKDSDLSQTAATIEKDPFHDAELRHLAVLKDIICLQEKFETYEEEIQAYKAYKRRRNIAFPMFFPRLPDPEPDLGYKWRY